MGNLIVRQVDRGFNAHIRDAAELPQGSAADGSQNVLYSRGTIKTPFGFDKVLPFQHPLGFPRQIKIEISSRRRSLTS